MIFHAFLIKYAEIAIKGKNRYLFEDALVEDDDFDLLVMGRTQGKGCYCFVNGLLQNQLAKLYPNYPFMVVDNEAGMEHISRGILPGMDTAKIGRAHV